MDDFCRSRVQEPLTWMLIWVQELLGFFLPSQFFLVWGPQAQELCWGSFSCRYLQPTRIQNVSTAGLSAVAPMLSGGHVYVLGVQIFYSPNNKKSGGPMAVAQVDTSD